MPRQGPPEHPTKEKLIKFLSISLGFHPDLDIRELLNVILLNSMFKFDCWKGYT